MIERFVDYFQTSLSLAESAIILKGYKPIPPIRFYKRGYAHPMGFKLYFGNPNSKLANLVASGETMQSLRNDHYLDADILSWALSRGGKVSRLDLAVTEWIEDDLFTLGDVRTWYEQGLIDASLAKYGCKTIASVSKGGGEELQTVYIGDIKSRGKKGIFRAYDKGVEMGLGSEIATRIELELKRENAHSVAKRLADTNDIAGNFRSKFNVASVGFERLMEADAVQVTRGKNLVKQSQEEELSRRWEWLISQVAPALGEAIAADRAAGLGDVRLTEFLQKAGLLKEIQKGVVANAGKLHDNYLQSIGVQNGRFKSKELD